MGIFDSIRPPAKLRLTEKSPWAWWKENWQPIGALFGVFGVIIAAIAVWIQYFMRCP